MRREFHIIHAFKNTFFTRPEADPAVLLAWIENDVDLANIHRAARVK